MPKRTLVVGIDRKSLRGRPCMDGSPQRDRSRSYRGRAGGVGEGPPAALVVGIGGSSTRSTAGSGRPNAREPLTSIRPATLKNITDTDPIASEAEGTFAGRVRALVTIERAWLPRMVSTWHQRFASPEVAA